MLNGGDREARYNVMKQQCPKCGNWVEGKKRENISRQVTSSIVKKGGANLVGAAIGTFIAPGIGTFLGGAAANLLISDDINKVADKANDALYGSADYEYACPNCGYAWIASADSGDDNQAARDQLSFQQAWECFFENVDDILSTSSNVDAFISEWDAKEIISPVPNSEMNFFLAFCAYCAIEIDYRYYSISQKYINRALRIYSDTEYQLFVEVLNNKANRNRNTESIVRNSFKLIDKLNENELLLKKEWYVNELQSAVDEEVERYKVQKMEKAKFLLIKSSVICVPILFFIIYKYVNYDVPDGFWSAVFSWVIVYWTCLLYVGGAYLFVLCKFAKLYSRKDNEWENLLMDQYFSFKWSSLLK